jgi:hypothetical protein
MQDLQNITCISFNENKDPCTISASKLESMYKSLKILVLGNLIKVDGQCKNVFEKLVCFQGGISHILFHMSKELRYFKYEPEEFPIPEASPRHIFEFSCFLFIYFKLVNLIVLWL